MTTDIKHIITEPDKTHDIDINPYDELCIYNKCYFNIPSKYFVFIDKEYRTIKVPLSIYINHHTFLVETLHLIKSTNELKVTLNTQCVLSFYNYNEDDLEDLIINTIKQNFEDE